MVRFATMTRTAALAPPRTFTRDDYYRMAEAGILTEDDRVELLEGEIVRMTPIGKPHASVVDCLTALFSRQLGSRAIVRVQNPIVLNDLSEPQPDVTLLKQRADFYRREHPRPRDILLLVEVIGSEKDYDRSVKLPLYARAGIREVWLVDLLGDAIETHRKPTPRGYRELAQKGRGARIAPAAFPRTFFAVADMLGR